MAERIYKYELPITDESVLHIPGPAQILSVGEQFDGCLFMWAIVDPDRRNMRVEISIRGTGHPIDGNEGRHIETVTMKSGLVWHVFVGIGPFGYEEEN